MDTGKLFKNGVHVQLHVEEEPKLYNESVFNQLDKENHAMVLQL